MSLDGSIICSDPYDVTSTSVLVSCIPYEYGERHFYIGIKAGGKPIQGSTNLYVKVQ